MKPFVKWAGGKKQILQQIKAKIYECKRDVDAENYTFIEPFVGGGVVFLNLKNKNTIINDLNKELITAYRVVRNNPNELMAKLDEMLVEFNNDKESYYKTIRAVDREENYSSLDYITIAARMIFLNKTCFNGLYRVNSEGYFNTPLGRNKFVSFYDKNNLIAVSRYLQKIPEENIMNGSYKKAMEKAKFGDIVYVDPPYDYTENDGFTKYQKEGFSQDELAELKESCDRCIDDGAYVIISNNDTNKVRETFLRDENHNYCFYYIESINTKRMINCKGNLRNTGKEIIIVGFPCMLPNVHVIDNLIECCRSKKTELLEDNEKLSKRFNIKPQTASKYRATLQYFGLLSFDDKLTDNGKKIRKSKKADVSKEMKKIILSKPIMKKCFEIPNGEETSNKVFENKIIEKIKEEYPNIPDSLAKKKADIIKLIIEWCSRN